MKRFFKPLLALAITVSTLLSLSGVAQAASLDEIKQRGVLKVGIFTDKPPFGFVDTKGQYVGFDTDLAKRFAKDLLGDASKIEFVVVEAASRVPFLQSGKVDIIMANMTVTPERARVVDFTNPNLRVATQVLVKADSPVKSIQDLAGKTVIVTKGTTADIYLSRNYRSTKLLKFEKNTEALQALQDGRADAYAQDNLILLTFRKDHPDFRLLPEKLEADAPIAPAVQKGNDSLRNWVNAELAALGEEKFLHQLYQTYLAPGLAADTKPETVIVEGGRW
ncbi:transporter substrate-binding domain-containing protein [Rheinheimera texasensis]|uniref:transporter substrate-binding domain-containing protein n=1 Tax=Rheinheimera texasensis TaxID=306205 RepID=UPI0032B27159